MKAFSVYIALLSPNKVISSKDYTGKNVHSTELKDSAALQVLAYDCAAYTLEESLK